LAQGAIGSIVHDQERSGALDTKIEDTHNMRMDEMSNRTCLSAKGVDILIGQLRVEHLDGSLGSQVNVLTEVDFGKPAFAQYTDEAIVAKLVSDTAGAIGHLCFLCLCGFAYNVCA